MMVEMQLREATFPVMGAIGFGEHAEQTICNCSLGRFIDYDQKGFPENLRCFCSVEQQGIIQEVEHVDGRNLIAIKGIYDLIITIGLRMRKVGVQLKGRIAFLAFEQDAFILVHRGVEHF